jgi:flagellar motor component MotA
MTRHTVVFVFVLDIIIIFKTFINAIFIKKNSYRVQQLINSFYHTFKQPYYFHYKNSQVINLFFIKANVDVSFN